MKGVVFLDPKRVTMDIVDSIGRVGFYKNSKVLLKYQRLKFFTDVIKKKLKKVDPSYINGCKVCIRYAH